MKSVNCNKHLIIHAYFCMNGKPDMHNLGLFEVTGGTIEQAIISITMQKYKDFLNQMEVEVMWQHYFRKTLVHFQL